MFFLQLTSSAESVGGMSNIIILANEFWSQWRKEYLLSLQKRKQSGNDVGVDDIMIIKDDNAPHSRWQLARVCAVK